jgi:hypothetical protein
MDHRRAESSRAWVMPRAIAFAHQLNARLAA